jgi:hypothetical protein
MLFIFTVMIVYAFQVFTFCMSIPRLLELHRFYTHLLGIPDVSLRTRQREGDELMSRWISRPFRGQRLFV